MSSKLKYLLLFIVIVDFDLETGHIPIIGALILLGVIVGIMIFTIGIIFKITINKKNRSKPYRKYIAAGLSLTLFSVFEILTVNSIAVYQKRITYNRAEIKHKSLLEYKNLNNSWPKNLNQLIPNYVIKIPKPAKGLGFLNHEYSYSSGVKKYHISINERAFKPCHSSLNNSWFCSD